MVTVEAGVQRPHGAWVIVIITFVFVLIDHRPGFDMRKTQDRRAPNNFFSSLGDCLSWFAGGLICDRLFR